MLHLTSLRYYADVRNPFEFIFWLHKLAQMEVEEGILESDREIIVWKERTVWKERICKTRDEVYRFKF